MDNLNINALSNYIKGILNWPIPMTSRLDAGLQAKFNMADIKQFYPLDSMTLKGDLNADVKVKGKYVPAKHQFPVTVANIMLHDGSVQTKYYPHPIEKINVNTSITTITAP